MSDLLKQISEQLAGEVATLALAQIEKRLDAHAKEDLKLFWSFREVALLLGCSVSTVRLRAQKGELGYTRNLNGEKGCQRHHLEDYFKRREVRAAGAIIEKQNLFQMKRSAQGVIGNDTRNSRKNS